MENRKGIVRRRAELLVKQFITVTEAGEKFTVTQKRRVWRLTSPSGKAMNRYGAPNWSLLDGRPVEKIDNQTFRISGTDIVLRRSIRRRHRAPTKSSIDWVATRAHRSLVFFPR